MKNYTSLLLFLPLLLFVPVPVADGWQNAFCIINVFGVQDHIVCNTMRDSITFEAGQNISILLDNTTNTITVSASSPYESGLLVQGESYLLAESFYGMPGDTFHFIYKGSWIGESATIIDLVVNGAVADSITIESQNRFIPWTLVDIYTVQDEGWFTVSIERTSGALYDPKLVYQHWRG